MTPRITNLFSPPPDGPHNPGVETIHPHIQTPALRLEQLISRGQASPQDSWYDQPEDEWVLLLRGTATLDFADDGLMELKAGDSLTIPTQQKHRVDQVSDDAVWVALHFRTEH